jgi:hypothetical protein
MALSQFAIADIGGMDGVHDGNTLLEARSLEVAELLANEPPRP